MGPLSTQSTDRRRLVVVQVLVMSLFVTLFARLWFLQVASGEEYQQQAASNAGRDLVVQPQRGLIVDDMGRPLVANRLSWVVTVDRDRMAEMTPRRRAEVMTSLAQELGEPLARLRSRTRTCGENGAPEPPCAGTGRPTSRSRWPTTSTRPSRCRSRSAARTSPASPPSSSTFARIPSPTGSTPRTCWATCPR
jgi:penicillin-binding protein 2